MHQEVLGDQSSWKRVMKVSRSITKRITTGTSCKSNRFVFPFAQSLLKDIPLLLIAAQIVQTIRKYARIGFPLRVSELRSKIYGYCLANQIEYYGLDHENQTVGKRLWRNFKARHPEVVIKSVTNLSVARGMACNRENIFRWFDKFEEQKRVRF